MGQQDTVELRQIVTTIRRWSWLILACVLFAAIISLAVTSRMPSEYRATTTLLVAMVQDPQDNEYNSLIAAERMALTYSQMVQDTSNLESAIGQLGLDMRPEILAKRVLVESVKDTQLLRITVRDQSPARAALLADAVADAFTQRASALQGERYRGEIATAQAQMEAQLAIVQQTQVELDSAAAGKKAEDTALARLQD